MAAGAAGRPGRPRAAGRRGDGPEDAEDSDDADDRGGGGGGGAEGDDDDDDAGGPPGPPGPQGPPGPPGGGAQPLHRLLQYDNAAGNFKVSLTRTFRLGQFQPRSAALRDALHEYTVTRLWLIECSLPHGDVTDARLQGIAGAYFDIEEASFMRRFKAVVGGPTEQEHKESEVRVLPH